MRTEENSRVKNIVARLGVNPPPAPVDGLAGELRTVPGGGGGGVAACRTIRGDGGWIEVDCGFFPCVGGAAGGGTSTRGESEAVGVTAGGEAGDWLRCIRTVGRRTATGEVEAGSRSLRTGRLAPVAPSPAVGTAAGSLALLAGGAVGSPPRGAAGGIETRSLLTFTVRAFSLGSAVGAAGFSSSFTPAWVVGSSFSAGVFGCPDKYFWRTGRPGIFGRDAAELSAAFDAPSFLGLSAGAEG